MCVVVRGVLIMMICRSFWVVMCVAIRVVMCVVMPGRPLESGLPGASDCRKAKRLTAFPDARLATRTPTIEIGTIARLEPC